MIPLVRQVHDFLPDAGEMGKRICSFNWSDTPVGPIERWPESLKTAVRICIGSRHPMVLWWGKSDLMQFYNDAYISFLGAAKHPRFLGKSGRECWSEIWHIMQPMLESVFKTGEATWSEDFLYVLNRNLPREEGYFTFSYSPIWDDSGSVGGIFCSCSETTGRVIGERQLRTLRDLGRTVVEAKTGEEACELTAETLASNRADIPFALMYLVDDKAAEARLVAAMGVKAGIEAVPTRIDMNDAVEATAWPLHRVRETGTAELVIGLETRFGSLPGAPWPEPPEAALVLPIALAGQAGPIGFLVAGFSPRRVLDADYRIFLDLIAGHLTTAISNARASEEERRRAAALAELDRAKTQFFSNVSHEFRTPLTLMLGPLENVLQTENGISPQGREQLVTAHRNSLRLLKLVNSLLDFSRIEAGRMNASYEPVDLSTFTTDLASNFRSAMEAGGLELQVDCKGLLQPVYVDREMWEKIVLNLLSNAFKFTFEGRVTVRLQASNNHAVLTVSDTGVGIPETELPHIFERFHRVEGAKGRTYEGTGIGLALIQELVKLHGGTVHVGSRPGEGSTFTVSLPFGSAHLPPDRIGTASKDGHASTAVRAGALTGEALTCIAGTNFTQPVDGLLVGKNAQAAYRPRILLADDNADMREHVSHILGSQYDLVAVSDGRTALEEARRRRPDLVLSDIMMPQLDGLGLLKELRADGNLREVPLIFLSARAGEEARIDGIAAGADDYLTKPFSAAELNVRVHTVLALRRIRRESSEAVAALNAELNADLAAMNRMQQLSTRLIQAEELDTLLGEILEAAIEITRADKGNIQLFQGAAWQIVQQRGFEAPFLDFFNRAERSTSACGTAFERGERVIVEDVAQSPIFKGTQALHVMLAARALAVQSTPLISRSGRMLGMLSTHYSNAPRKPTERDLRLLDILARQAADLIERNSHEEVLRESEAQFRNLAEAIPQLSWMAYADGHIFWYNSRWYEYTGTTFEQMEGRGWQSVLDPEMLPAVMERWTHSIRTGDSFEMVFPLRGADDLFRPFLTRAVPVRDDKGRVVRWFGTNTDITKQKEIEKELRNANADLEQFAYSASHDLQEPLRTVKIFSELLARHSAERLDGKALEFLNSIMAGASRMEALVRDLLAYTQAMRLEIPAETFDGQTALDGSVSNLKAAIEESGATIHSDPLPALRVHGTHLQQLFQNLISNAIKYRRTGVSPVVRITANRQNGGWLFSVNDNGIGIEAQYNERIFGLFKRLHTGDRYSGTGIGLAICQRIVDRYHGRIWVESEPGKGSAFYFWLPS